MINILVIHNTKDEIRRKNIEEQFKKQVGKNPYTIVCAEMNPSQPQVGIMRSFKNCIKIAQHQKWRQVMIMEDDFNCLSKDAIKTFKWIYIFNFKKDTLFVAGAYDGNPVPISSELAKMENRLAGLHAIIVHESLYETFLKAEEPYNLDYWLTQEAKVPVLCCYPMLIMQNDGFSYNVNKQTTYSESIHLRYKLINR